MNKYAFYYSLAGIMKVDITIPDFSSLSKRSITSAYPNQSDGTGKSCY